MSRLSFGCPRSGDSMGIPQMTMGVSHCGHEDIPGDGPTWGYPMCPMSQVSQYLGDIPGHPEDGPTWGYPMCPMSQVSQYLGTSQDIPGHPEDGPTWGYPMCPMSQVSQYLGTSQDIPRMVPHGATLCVLCLKCPSTWGHPRTSRGWSHMGLPYVSYVSSVPVLGDIPGHPEDGPTWGYPMCPMSQVSQYLGTSQDIPRMVPHGATLCVLCLKCPSTWGHPRTSRGWSHMGLPYVSYVSSVPQYLGTSQGMVPHGATLCVLCLKCPSTWGHPRTWSHMGLPYVSYVSSVPQYLGTSQDMVPHGATLCVLCLKCPPVLGDIPGHGPTWGYPMCPMSQVSQYLGTSQDIPGDGPTWGYPMCPMSQVSQYLGTSQDIPRMVPHGATLCVLCLKCPSTWGHPRGWSHMGLPYVSYVSSVPVLGDIPGHPRGWSHMGLPYVSYVSSVPVLGDIPGHPGDGPSWGNPGYILSCSLAETADEVITSAQY